MPELEHSGSSVCHDHLLDVSKRLDVCPPSRRAKFQLDGENTGPGDDERLEDTGDGWVWPLLSLAADLHAAGHRRSDRCPGLLVRHQTPGHPASLQPAAPVRGSPGRPDDQITARYLKKVFKPTIAQSNRLEKKNVSMDFITLIGSCLMTLNNSNSNLCAP